MFETESIGAPFSAMGASQIGFDDGRVVRDAVWVALRDLLAVADAENAVGDRHDDAHVVLDDEDRDPAAMDLLHDLDRLLDLRRIQPREVLVEEEERGFRRESAR